MVSEPSIDRTFMGMTVGSGLLKGIAFPTVLLSALASFGHSAESLSPPSELDKVCIYCLEGGLAFSVGALAEIGGQMMRCSSRGWEIE